VPKFVGLIIFTGPFLDYGFSISDSLYERDELLNRIQELEDKCRRAEDAPSTLEERDRLLGDSAPFGIFVMDTEGHIFGANQKILDMLSWPADQDITQ
jgi:PAS domain-containing protein